MIAITNFWNLAETNPEAFNAIYREMVGDAYSHSAIEDAFEAYGYDPHMTDMSEFSYRPVLTKQQATDIERRFKVKLSRATVKARPDVGPKLYELTHVSPHRA